MRSWATKRRRPGPPARPLRAVVIEQLTYAFGIVFVVLAVRKVVVAAYGGATVLGTLGLAPAEESFFYRGGLRAAAAATTATTTADRCLAAEGDLCREACADWPWTGRYNRQTELAESCFRVERAGVGAAAAARLLEHDAAYDGDGSRTAGTPKAGGRSAAAACCAFGGGRTIALREAPRLVPAAVEPDALAAVPRACRSLVATDFPSIHDLYEAGGAGGHVGARGGKWTACTHLDVYGLNFAAFHARHLAYGLRPRTVLEFGCGLGTTADFLARHVPGGARVVCVEPEVMLGEVFAPAARAGAARPVQISVETNHWFDRTDKP